MSNGGRPYTRLDAGKDAAAYNRAISGPARYGPMVCICKVPQADPKINWGECAVCHRKPLTLFTVKAVIE